jgi:hypothetical protein
LRQPSPAAARHRAGEPALIEDLAVVTEDGHTRLTQSPKELIVLA